MSDQPNFLGGLPTHDAAAVGVQEPVPPHSAGSGQGPTQLPAGKRNTFALVSFIGSFFVALVGIIFGHIALSQIKRTGETGHGFAIAGVIIGYAAFVSQTIAMIVMLVIAGAATSAVTSAANDVKSSIGNDSNISAGAAASSELCAALDAFTTAATATATATDPAATAVPPEMLAAAQGLAAVEGPNQAYYQSYADLLADPTSVTSISDASALASDFGTAVQADMIGCM